MTPRSNLDDYEKQLGKLEGNSFEEEVCARLQSMIVDFQNVVAKPRGDGGLDGLSHQQEHAYCCYGPEQEVRKLDNKGLKDDIIKKFSSDLRKLFELGFEMRKLRHEPNEELQTIMGKDRKIQHIRLIVSWYESHRVLGPLRTAFDKYKSTSQLRFVDENATLTVWGPKNLAALGAVDEHTLFRIQNPALIASLQAASASDVMKDGGGDFDAKFDDLKRRQASATARIDSIAQKFREAWAAALALEDDLSKNSLILHQTLESVREDAALLAQVKSMSAIDPYFLIETMREEVAKNLGQGFGEKLGPLTPRIAHGVVAGLIGECPIDWRNDYA